jgi:hypothetical protein
MEVEQTVGEAEAGPWYRYFLPQVLH